MLTFFRYVIIKPVGTTLNIFKSTKWNSISSGADKPSYNAVVSNSPVSQRVKNLGGRRLTAVGSISGQIGHICRYGRHQADVGRRSALIGQKIGTYRPYMPIWLTSGRRQQHIGTNRPYLPIWPTPGRKSAEDWHSSARRSALIGHICRYG